MIHRPSPEQQNELPRDRHFPRLKIQSNGCLALLYFHELPQTLTSRHPPTE